VLEERIAAGISKYGTRRAEGLDMLRLSEVTVDLCSISSYVSDWSRLDPTVTNISKKSR